MTKTTAQSSPKGKLGVLVRLLRRANGATILDLAKATGWQTKSVRGAMAGALKKRGIVVTSEKIDDVRRYRIAAASHGTQTLDNG